MPARKMPAPPRAIIDTILSGNAVTMLKQLPSQCADMVITSPPYYMQRSYNNSGLGAGVESRPNHYIDGLMDAFAECVRVIKPTGNIVYNLGDKYLKGSLALIPFRFAMAACENHDVRLINEITWVKRNPTPRQFTRRLVSSTEPFFHFAIGNDYYYDRNSFYSSGQDQKFPTPGPNIGQKYRDLIETSDLTKSQKQIARRELQEVIDEVIVGKTFGFRMKIKGIHAEAFGGQGGGRKTQMDTKGFTIIRLKGQKMQKDVIEHQVETLHGNEHTAVFPLGIIREFIRLLCPVGGLVIDPYVGSGTTAVAAIKEGRHYLGIDVDHAYCMAAKERIQKARGIKDAA